MIKNDVVAAVQEFFEHGRLYVTVNCALVTLILKTNAAKIMKEMRPIACCTTLYKLISKILTTHLIKVINVIVDDTQPVFIPGKVIHENNIISHEPLRGYGRNKIYPRCAVQMDLQKSYDFHCQLWRL